MMKALAPRLLRGCPWVLLSIVVGGALGPLPIVVSQARAQEPAEPATAPEQVERKTEAAAQPVEKAKAAPAPPAAAPAAEAPAAEDDNPLAADERAVELFKDPRAEAALSIFENVQGIRDCRPSDVNAVMSMAAGQSPTDRATVQRFVDGMAYRLLDKTNINGLIAPPPNAPPTSSSLRGIRDASANLMDAINRAKLAKNQQFLLIYRQALLETLPKLLDKNLVTRIQAILVLGEAGDPNAIPVFLAQLKKEDQTVWVKHWAAKGLYNVAEGGPQVDRSLSVKLATEAGKALVDFIQAEPDLPWPVKLRALEAMGAMRQAAEPLNLRKAEMSNAAIAILSDPEERPAVRAAAAWAIGMARVNSAIDKYNFALVAHAIGRLALDLGTEVADSYDGKPMEALDPTRAEYLAGLLVGPVYQSLFGLEGVRETGLTRNSPTHPNFSASQQPIKDTADLVSSVAKAAVELVRTTPGSREARKKDLVDRLGALKAQLDKLGVKDFHLVPEGPEYPPAASPAAAGEPVAANRSAAAPVGR